MNDELLDRYRAHLSEHNVRASDDRMRIAASLISRSKPFTAAELVADRAKYHTTRPHIYRILAELCEAGVLKRVNGEPSTYVRRDDHGRFP